MATYRATFSVFSPLGFSRQHVIDARTRASWALPEDAKVTSSSTGAMTAVVEARFNADSPEDAELRIREAARSTGHSYDSVTIREVK